MKVRLAALLTFAISFAMPTFAQEQSAVDPEVRQQIEAVLTKYEDAYNKHDAAAIAALYTTDAAEVFDEYTAGGGSASGREAIQQTYAGQFASSPIKLSLKLVQVYAIGDDVCAVSEFSRHLHSGKGYNAKILVREPDGWKIRMAIPIIDRNRKADTNSILRVLSTNSEKARRNFRLMHDVGVVIDQ